MYKMAALVAAGFILIACTETTTAPTDPITARLAGNTLFNDNLRFTTNEDGSLVGTTAGGENIAGTWAVRDGKWCRTLSEPERLVGSACQDITLNDDGTVTIVGVNGPGTFQFE